MYFESAKSVPYYSTPIQVQHFPNKIRQNICSVQLVSMAGN